MIFFSFWWLFQDGDNKTLLIPHDNILKGKSRRRMNWSLLQQMWMGQPSSFFNSHMGTRRVFLESRLHVQLNEHFFSWPFLLHSSVIFNLIRPLCQFHTFKLHWNRLIHATMKTHRVMWHPAVFSVKCSAWDPWISLCRPDGWLWHYCQNLAALSTFCVNLQQSHSLLVITPNTSLVSHDFTHTSSQITRLSL